MIRRAVVVLALLVALAQPACGRSAPTAVEVTASPESRRLPTYDRDVVVYAALGVALLIVGGVLVRHSARRRDGSGDNA